MDEKELIEAAKMLKDFCKNEMRGKCFSEKCLFADGKRCFIKDCPCDWDIPKPCRWTYADIALAKALKAFSVLRVKRVSNGGIRATLGFGNGSCGVPKGAFAALLENEEVFIDDIIAEGENA